MKKFITMLLLSASMTLFAQADLSEVVYLKNGSKIHGIILEQIPNEKIKIQTDDGSIFVFKYSEILKITKEQTNEITRTPIQYSKPAPNTNYGNNNNSNSGVLQNGSPVFVKLLNTISSGSTDEPNFVISEAVKDATGNVLISDGAPVRCEYKATKRKAIGRPGTIEIKFISVAAADGQFITLNGSKSYAAVDRKGKVIGIAVGIGVGLPLCLPVLAYLAKKGEDIEVPAGTMLTNNVMVMGNYTIK